MSNSHTPGPWHKLCAVTQSGICGASIYGQIESDGQPKLGSHIAEVFGQHTTIDEANARLIAAAPELLEACKAVLANADKRQLVATVETEELCRAAIAKATGGAQ